MTRVATATLRPAALQQSVVEYLNPRMKLAYFAQKTWAQ
jgi:hypothetical protein